MAVYENNGYINIGWRIRECLNNERRQAVEKLTIS